MSITKIGKAKSSSDAIEYILKVERNDEKQPQIIGGNIIGSNLEDIKKEFRSQEKLNFKVKNTVTHISVSFPVGKVISNKLANNYAVELINELGFADNPFLVVRHFDKDDRETEPYSHIHIVASRIKNDGSIISEWKLAEKTIEISQKIDKKYELQTAQYQIIKQGQREERNIKKNEYRVMQKSGRLSILEEFKDAADEALLKLFEFEKSYNLSDGKTQFFVSELQQKGFEVLPFLSKNNQQMKGFSFKKDKIIFTASKAGKKFSWTNLANKLEYKHEKDWQFLFNLQAQVLHKTVKIILYIDRNGNPNSNQSEIIENYTTELENKQTQINLHERQNEKTNKFTENKSTDNKSTIKLFESINGNVEKEESNFATETPKLAETTRNESAESLEKTEFIRKESAEIGNSRATNQAIGSREIVVGDEETTNNIDQANLRANRIKKEGIGNGTFSNSESNKLSETTFEQIELEHRDFESDRNRSQSSIRDFDQKSSNSQTKLSDFQATSRDTENGFSEPRKVERYFNSGNSVEEQFEPRSGNLESESDDFPTTSSNYQHEQKVKISSDTNRRSEKRNQENRKEAGELGENLHENRDSFYSVNIDNFIDNYDVSKAKPRICGSKSGTETELRNIRTEISTTQEFYRPFLQSQSENDSNVSASKEVLGTSGGGTTETDSRKRSKISQTAKITVEVINVKFFSAQLDNKFVEKWTTLLEKSDTETILREVIKPKTHEENVNFTQQIKTQAELIAENLNIEKPAFSEKPKIDKLALTLTKIETKNYAEHNQIEVNEKTINRLAQANVEAAKLENTHISDKNNTDYSVKLDKPDLIIPFDSEFERQVFNSLLDPEKVKFDPIKILETQESVRVDEVAANETVRLIQVAYGGQNEKFNNKLKTDLAENIYQQSERASQIYNNFREFDWQKTMQNFAPLVNNLAEQNGFKIEPPKTEAEKNQLLAQNLTQDISSISNTNGETVDKHIQNCINQNLLTSAHKLPYPTQIKNTLGLTDNSLQPPIFKSSLENSFYYLDKIDDDTKSEKVEKFVKTVKEAEKVKEEKQREERKMQMEMEFYMGRSQGRSM